MVKIEKDIPYTTKMGRPYKYPWGEMQVGDSFLIPSIHSPYSMVRAYNKTVPKKKQIKITCKIEGEGRRVWRIK